MVKLIAPPHQIADNPNQITPHGAADATVVHLKDFFIGVNDQLVIDTHFTELVDNHSNLKPVFVGKDAVEECGFPRSQVTCQNGNWYRT
jgi:hypothetical protein